MTLRKVKLMHTKVKGPSSNHFPTVNTEDKNKDMKGRSYCDDRSNSKNRRS